VRIGQIATNGAALLTNRNHRKLYERERVVEPARHSYVRELEIQPS